MSMGLTSCSLLHIHVLYMLSLDQNLTEKAVTDSAGATFTKALYIVAVHMGLIPAVDFICCM